MYKKEVFVNSKKRYLSWKRPYKAPSLWERIKAVFKPPQSDGTVYFHLEFKPRDGYWSVVEAAIHAPPGNYNLEIKAGLEGELYVNNAMITRF